MAKFNVGEKWFYLTILEKSSKRGDTHIIAKCDCGTVKRIRLSSFYAVRPVKSCGCKRSELLSKGNIKHGHSRTSTHSASRTYSSWVSMKERCEEVTHKSYADYGGRGITVCDRWHDFQLFLSDVGERPAGKTIGRIENDGNYEPENCEWQTYQEQSRNMRSNRYLEFDGKRLLLCEWAERIGVSEDAIAKRLDTLEWSIGRALTTPGRRQKNSICNWQA